MEPAEDTSLVAAIQWLVGTILGVLLMDKLDAWVRGVKLDDDVTKLKFEVERAELLIDDVRGRAGGNKPLARSLAHLKELLYDADDVVDELDYYRLQQQVEGVRSGEPEGMQGPDRVNEMSMGDADTQKNSSVGKTQSLVWNHFRVTEEDHGKRARAKCNYCGKEYHCKSAENGTTGMRTHMKKKHTQIWDGGATVNQPNPSSTGEAPGSATATVVSTSSSRKRRRPNEEPAQTTAALICTPWDKAELSNRIKTVTCQLQVILETLNKDLDRHGSGSASNKRMYNNITSIGSMTSLQELHDYKVQCSSGFEITQLQSMNELVQLGVSQLDNVKTQEEAYGARLRNKIHLEKLHFSWRGEYSSATSQLLDLLISESSEKLLPTADGGPSSELSMGTAKEVLEGLKPHMNLKHLQISGYNGATSPTWLASNISVTSLQTLHLDGCKGWRILPSLESLPFIRKLKLRNMQEVTEVLVPSLEELVLIRMPKLVRCSSTSVEGLNCILRALQIEKCEALKEFDLFENGDSFKIEQRPWLPGLRRLILRDCPRMKVLNPLPPSTISCELHISGVSILPSMKGLSSKKLYIGYLNEGEDLGYETDVSSDKLTILNDQILAFDNLRNLKSMRIAGFRNLRSFSLEDFSHLVSLKSLKISLCRKLFCSDMMSDATLEHLTAANWKAFPCLESLSIEYCGIGGKWLSLLLRHAPDLEELYLKDILPTKMRDSSLGEEDDALSVLAQDGLVHIPLNLISSLKKITIKHCHHLTFNCSEEGFSGFTSLQELIIWGEYAKPLSSLVHKDGNDLTSLKRLVVQWSPGLESLQLHSCTALEELTIKFCGPLIQLEGLQSLGRLRRLVVSYCPGLGPCLESFSRQGCELFPQLETLETNDPSVLTMSFCNHLRCLQLHELVLSEEQGRALVLLMSLQELKLVNCPSLVDLPAGLHLLPSLKKLNLLYCQGISRLPETGLPLSLEELEIFRCSNKLNDQCKGLATSKLRVKINGVRWVL
ncbi:hypothetical protein ACQ4PT_011400 [Festuca glaucescens]